MGCKATGRGFQLNNRLVCFCQIFLRWFVVMSYRRVHILFKNLSKAPVRQSDLQFITLLFASSSLSFRNSSSIWRDSAFQQMFYIHFQCSWSSVQVVRKGDSSSVHITRISINSALFSGRSTKNGSSCAGSSFSGLLYLPIAFCHASQLFYRRFSPDTISSIVIQLILSTIFDVRHV